VSLGFPAQSEEDEDNDEELADEVDKMMRNPERIHASITRATEPPTYDVVTLEHQNGVWVGGSIRVFRDKVIIEDKTYPIRWNYPLYLEIRHGNDNVCITL